MNEGAQRPPSRSLVLEAGAARAVVEPAEGGRLSSITVDGHELLANDDRRHPIGWGCYPMAPWAGRVRHGMFRFAGREHPLPLAMPPHAIHGVVFDRPWTPTDDATISIELDNRWPFRGRIRQRFWLDEAGLRVSMTLEADEPMPVTLGWHPWFRRVLQDGDDAVTLRFAADAMLVRDAEGIPSGERVTPPPGPWDDAFTGLREDPALEWPGRLRVELASSCDWWVVYSEPRHAICVEPQSGPPDALNSGAPVIEPGAPLTHEMRWRWTRL